MAPNSDVRPPFVCAIGASAGGLKPLEQLFSSLPPDSGMAFVVVQHLSPDHDSFMDELLARRTPMPVEVAFDGMAVAANHVYLMPPGKEMTIDQARLHLHNRPEHVAGERPHLPIDAFMCSLAQDYGQGGIAIILSGTGSDGSEGVVAIRQAGGLTLAQDTSASFDGMPNSARETSAIDASMPPERMYEALVNYREHGRRPTRSELDLANPAELEANHSIFDVLRLRFGLDFTQYKSATVGRRLTRRLQSTQKADPVAYTEVLANDESEQDALFRDLLVGVTSFYRDRNAFAELATAAIPDIVSAAVDEQRSIRVWVPACASGEEAYTIAMLILDEVDARSGFRPRVQVFATDVHPDSIQFASRGVYSSEALFDIPEATREKYFVPVGDGGRVRPELRSVLTFAPHNILHDAPFTRIDLVSCRNLLIYFRSAAQTRAMASLHFALRLGGYLLLGSSESIGSLEPDFSAVSRPWRIFRKERLDLLHAVRRLPLGRASPPPARPESHMRLARPGVHSLVLPDQDMLRAYDRILDDQFVAGFLVTDKGDLLHSFGRADEWMQAPRGRPSVDLLQLLQVPELRQAAAAALNHVRETHTATSVPGVPMPNSENTATLIAKPLDRNKARRVLMFVRPDQEGATPPPLRPPESEQSSLIAHLDTELQHTRQDLQSAIEELETSNEELNASNEELVASNEELQSTNEELSSVNEELRSLNDEHRRKLDQLTEASADLNSLLEDNEIAAVFLSENLRVRRYTESALRYFRLRRTDVGRHLLDIANDIGAKVPNFETRLRQAAQDLRASAVAIELNGQRVFVRFLPYQRNEALRGAVLFVFDLSALARDP